MYDTIINTLIDNNFIKATKFISKDKIIRATRTRYGGKFSKGNIEITLSIGRPNFAEREYIKKNKEQKFPYDYLLTKSLILKKKKLKRFV